VGFGPALTAHKCMSIQAVQAVLLFVLAQQLASDPFIFVVGRVLIILQQMLDVHRCRRAGENEMGHRQNMTGPETLHHDVAQGSGVPTLPGGPICLNCKSASNFGPRPYCCNWLQPNDFRERGRGHGWTPIEHAQYKQFRFCFNDLVLNRGGVQVGRRFTHGIRRTLPSLSAEQHRESATKLGGKNVRSATSGHPPV
jgi:hypothetical protein